MAVSSRSLRIALTLCGTLLLSACGIFGNQVDLDISPEMKQKCPPVGIVAHTGEITRFAGNSRDASAVTERATLGKLVIKCRDTENEAGLFADITFDISAKKGPAARSNSTEFPFFVTVSRGNDAVLERNLYTSAHTFDENNWSAFRESVTAYVPLGEEGRILDYEILIGFQLSKGELKYNLAR